MPMNQPVATGARLAYVVVDLSETIGTVFREVCEYKKGVGVVTKKVEEPAGFLVYFPRGHVIRLKNKEELRRYGLDGRPPIINLEGLSDPRSAIGQMLFGQDDAARRGAMESLEKQVIKLATAMTGPIVMPEQLEPTAA